MGVDEQFDPEESGPANQLNGLAQNMKIYYPCLIIFMLLFLLAKMNTMRNVTRNVKTQCIASLQNIAM